MTTLLRRVSLCFAAGCFGALVNSFLIWYLGRKGIPQRFEVALAPELNKTFLYARLVWGGLWGQAFCLPFWQRGFWTGVLGRGILLGFLPTLFQLFYVFPALQGKGMLGLSLGSLTPVFVSLYNAVWGIAAGLWLFVAKVER
jgi:hypothetical protein